MSRWLPTHTMAFQPKPKTFLIALALYCFLQSVEVSGHLPQRTHTQPQQPQVIPIPQYIPVPQYQQQPQIIPVPQYVQQPQYIPVPQYMPQQPMYYPQPSYHHHRPQFDCYRGIKLDEIISDVEKIEP